METTQKPKCKFCTLQLFTTGFIQVYFVAINTYLISNENYIGVLLASFMISIIWSFNVKKVAFGSLLDRMLYSFGAASGGVVGLFTSANLFKIITP
jgi:hypothetical protein